MFLIYTNILKKINNMIKKFYEFRSGPDTDVEEPITKPITKPITPSFPNPYEDGEDDDDDLDITPDFKPQPKLEDENLIIDKLKEVLKEKGMTLEDLYQMCINL